MITRHLKKLSQPSISQRLEGLKEILEIENLPYTLQEQGPSYKIPLGLTNVIMDPLDESPSVLLCAHYDAFHGSLGANDNASSVCILIDLAKELRKQGINTRICFFDGEENNQMGSKLYATQMDRKSITSIINLDMCGYGDSIVLTRKGNLKKIGLKPFTDKTYLKEHNATILRHLPTSDQVSFERLFPTMSISVVPYWDIQFLRSLASFSGGLFGKPPEYDMILEQMEITTTMHGGYRDNLEYINDKAMNMVYEFILHGLKHQD